MVDDAQGTLESLLKTLREIEATQLIEEITEIVARGKTSKIESENKTKQFTQEALTSDEALQVAIDLFISYLEPTFMITPIKKELSDEPDPQLVWKRDVVAKSPIKYESEDIEKFELNESFVQIDKNVRKLIALFKEDRNG